MNPSCMLQCHRPSLITLARKLMLMQLPQLSCVQDAFVIQSVMHNEQVQAEHEGLVVAYIVVFCLVCIVSMVSACMHK